MRASRIQKLLLLLAAVALMASGCKKAGNTTTGGSNGTNAPAAQSPATGGGSAKLEQGACALLTAEEVSTTFGATFQAGTETNANPENSVCTFKNDGTYHAEYASADVASRYQTLSSSYQGTESVSGVGDKAFWVEDEKLLVVLAGKRMFNSQLSGEADANTKENHAAIAKIAISKMKQ